MGRGFPAVQRVELSRDIADLLRGKDSAVSRCFHDGWFRDLVRIISGRG